MIYFYNLRGLIEELKVARPRSKENFCYCVAYVLFSMTMNLLSLGGSKTPEPSAASYAIALVIGIIMFGIFFFIFRMIYAANGGDEGQYFLDRLLALTWVAGFRVATLIVPLVILSRVAFTFIPNPDATLAFSVMGILLVVLVGSIVIVVSTVIQSFKVIRANELSQ
jgi:hypothetical protein